MKKLKMFSVFAGMFLLAIPMASYAEMEQNKSENNRTLILAQNANYVACYKEKDDMSKVLFRWRPTGSPWTATNDSRTTCYATSEACAAAEMPQSWCIKCEGKQ